MRCRVAGCLPHPRRRTVFNAVANREIALALLHMALCCHCCVFPCSNARTECCALCPLMRPPRRPSGVMEDAGTGGAGGRSVRFDRGGGRGSDRDASQGEAPEGAGTGLATGSPGGASRSGGGTGGRYSRVGSGDDLEGGDGDGDGDQGDLQDRRRSRSRSRRKPGTVEERQALLGMKPTAGAVKIQRGVKTADMLVPSTLWRHVTARWHGLQFCGGGSGGCAHLLRSCSKRWATAALCLR